VVSTMADPIYGIHQSQPFDIYSYMKANAKRLGLSGRFSYLPTLKKKAESGVIGLNDGVEMIISDQISYYEEPLMDGRTRRYAKLKVFLGAFGNFYRTPHLDSIEEEMRQLGYTYQETVSQFESATAFRAALGLGVNDPYINPVLLRSANLLEMKAGVATYYDSEHSISDAPYDGNEYVRVDGEWVLSDHFVHSNIDGGTAYV